MNRDPMDMFDEMDEMFARLFSRMSQDVSHGGQNMYGYHIVINNGDAAGGMAEIQPSFPRTSQQPAAEVHQIGEETKVITELPGVTDDSLRLDVKGTTLVIDAGDAENHYHTTAEIPGTDPATMTRSFKNGVLEVTFRSRPENVTGTTTQTE